MFHCFTVQIQLVFFLTIWGHIGEMFLDERPEREQLSP